MNIYRDISIGISRWDMLYTRSSLIVSYLFVFYCFTLMSLCVFYLGFIFIIKLLYFYYYVRFGHNFFDSMHWHNVPIYNIILFFYLLII
jgi:hypothetical protein